MKRLIISLLGICAALTIRANEGMWLPFLLENNIGEMREMGLHLTADDIYNINQACLKDAVVGFVDLTIRSAISAQVQSFRHRGSSLPTTIADSMWCSSIVHFKTIISPTDFGP